MNHPVQAHRAMVSRDEVLLRDRPTWPTARPPVPGMCCEHCVRRAVVWAWRMCRAVHLLTLESYQCANPDPGQAPADPDLGHEPWPPTVPSVLSDKDDFRDAACASLAAATWCSDAAAELRLRLPRIQDAEERRLFTALCYELCDLDTTLQHMSASFLLGARGDWQRDAAIQRMDRVCTDFGEMAILPWR